MELGALYRSLSLRKCITNVRSRRCINNGIDHFCNSNRFKLNQFLLHFNLDRFCLFFFAQICTSGVAPESGIPFVSLFCLRGREGANSAVLGAVGGQASQVCQISTSLCLVVALQLQSWKQNYFGSRNWKTGKLQSFSNCLVFSQVYRSYCLYCHSSPYQEERSNDFFLSKFNKFFTKFHLGDFLNYVWVLSRDSGSSDTGGSEVQLHDVTFTFSLQVSRFIFEAIFFPIYMCAHIRVRSSRFKCASSVQCSYFNAEKCGKAIFIPHPFPSVRILCFYDLCSCCMYL